jgi:hypothetical protein
MQQNNKWHVGKEIPIAMLIAILAQTFAAVWWAAAFSATVTTKLDDLSNQVAALTADKYTQHDAIRDNALMSEKIENVKQQVEEIKWQRRNK